MTETIIHDEASRKRVIDHILSLSLEGLPWKITVKRKTKRLSLSQNSLYWKWVGIAGKHFGYDPALMDIELKRHCDAPVENYTDLDGNQRQRFSTSNSDSAEMSAYMERVDRFLTSEHGILLPHPEDVQRRY